MSKIDDANYFQVSGFMVNRLKLKGVSLMVYAIIYGFTQDGESYFNGSRQYLCDFTNATKPTIDKALEELVNSNLIIKKSETINSITFNRYKANLDFTNFTTSKETLPPSKEALPPSKETLPNNIENKIKDNIDNNIINKENIKRKKSEIALVQNEINFDEILEHWNSLEIIKHRDMNPKTRKKIEALVKEGLTIDDILFAMDRYNQILKDDSYFFKYKWSLEEFILREKGIKEFLDNGSKWLNYINSSSGKKYVEKQAFNNMDLGEFI